MNIGQEAQDIDGNDEDFLPVVVHLHDGSIVQVNSVNPIDNPDGSGFLMETDYDILQLGTMPEEKVADELWSEIGPMIIYVMSQNPDVQAIVAAREKARLAQDQTPASPTRSSPRPGRRR